MALDSTGFLAVSLLPTGVGPDTATLTASEALSAGSFINVWNNAGTPSARKADASVSGKEAHGFVLSAFASGAQALVYFYGRNTAVTGQTAGPVYLSAATPGGATSTAPSGAGQTVQRIGVAVSASEINFEALQPIVLA